MTVIVEVSTVEMYKTETPEMKILKFSFVELD